MKSAAPDTRRRPGIAIVGTGFGGLCMAIQLRKAGIDTFTLLEKADSIGGTWRDNSYPGAACDVESHLYSYSFEPKSDWSRKFGTRAEIRAYLEDCADKYGLRAHIRFNTEVGSAAFDAQTGFWRLEMADGTTMEANILITACGQLNRPAYPDVPGMEGFQGKAFHSARWHHDYDLSDRSVAVIGTGASAIQFVPEIEPKVKALKLFQRSGAWVISKPDRRFTRFEQRLFARLPALARLYRSLIYWKNEGRALAFTRWAWLLEAFALTARWQAWRAVRDRAKRRQLIPDYKIGCKRILMSSNWYPAVAQAHVDLVTSAIDRIEADAVVTRDGRRHAVDAIIYATGFHATDFLAPIEIRGLHGRDLDDAWRDGAQAYKGICVNGFPNLFMLYGPNTNLAHSSIVFMLESQVHYVLKCVQALQHPAVDYMDVKAARQAEYNARIQRRLARTVWAAGCSSWYRTADGRNTNNWPGFSFRFRQMTATLDLGNYELVSAASDPRA